MSGETDNHEHGRDHQRRERVQRLLASIDTRLSDLSLQSVDIVLADAPVPPGSTVRAYNHLLGETGVGLFGTKALVSAYKRHFPRSLDGAPVLLPLENLPLRRSLEQWFERQGVKPRTIAEFEDSALLKAFGADGAGIFPAPMVVAQEISRQYGVQLLGHADGVHERFYAITAERRLKNAAIVAICAAARKDLFAADP